MKSAVQKMKTTFKINPEADRDRQSQTEVDRVKQKANRGQTETDRDRQSQTETDRVKKKKTESNKRRQRQIETDRGRQR